MIQMAGIGFPPAAVILPAGVAVNGVGTQPVRNRIETNGVVETGATIGPEPSLLAAAMGGGRGRRSNSFRSGCVFSSEKRNRRSSARRSQSHHHGIEDGLLSR